MKKTIIIAVMSMLFAVSAFSQRTTYVTSGFEILFSEANIKDVNNPDASSTLRFAPIISMQSLCNFDMNEKFGLFSGLGYRNVGYIYDSYSTVLPEGISTPIKKKFRTYNIGIPFGVKLGNMDGMFFYGGYEVEFPFVYKEKTFNTADEKVNTEVYWFGNRSKNVQQSWMVGVQFPYGMNLKFKYYFTEFHNQDFEANGVKPYEGLNSKIWYISFTKVLFRGVKFVAVEKY